MIGPEAERKSGPAARNHRDSGKDYFGARHGLRPANNAESGGFQWHIPQPPAPAVEGRHLRRPGSFLHIVIVSLSRLPTEACSRAFDVDA